MIRNGKRMRIGDSKIHGKSQILDHKIYLRNVFYAVLIGICLFLVFESEYIMNYTQLLMKYDAIIKLSIVVVPALLYFIHRKRTVDIMFFITIFVVCQIIVTLFNHSYIQLALWGNGVLTLSMCVFFQWGYKYNEDMFIKITYYLFYFLLIINFVTLFLFPEGLYVDARGERDTNFFLGNYNVFINYMLLAIVPGYFHLRNKGGSRQRIGYFLLWTLCFATLFIKNSVTSIVVLILLGIYMLLLNYKWTRMLLNVKTYIVINIIFFFSIVWNVNTGVNIRKVTDILGKDITFSGRTLIWSIAIRHIRERWIWGYGRQSQNAFRIAFDNIQASSCHNTYLNILYQNGIIGLAIIGIILMLVLHRLKYLKDLKVRYFLETCIGVYMLRGQFETADINVMFFMLLFIYLYSCKHSVLQQNRFKQLL